MLQEPGSAVRQPHSALTKGRTTCTYAVVQRQRVSGEIWAGTCIFVRRKMMRLPPRKPPLAALFDISPAELRAAGGDRIRDLVLERVALLDVGK